MIQRSFLVLAAASCGFAQTATEKMIKSSVAVFGTIPVEGGERKPVTRGGGFMIDSRHVVTNLGACCGKTDKGEKTTPLVAAAGESASTATVVWSSEDANIAILELKDPMSKPGVAIATFKSTVKDQPVYTAQYPDPGESGDTPKITEGKLTGLAKIQDTETRVYETTASMNKANAGGALFDACGNVIGINMRITEGVQYAYVVDPLLPGLQAVGLHPEVTEKNCGDSGATAGGGGEKAGEKKEEKAAPRRREWRLPQAEEWIPVLLLAAAIGMAFRPARNKAGTAPAPFPLAATKVPASRVPLNPLIPLQIRSEGKPVLCGVAGQYAGASVALDAGSITLGRDQRFANLVFPPEAGSVSKRHCTARWEAVRGVFVLEDLGSTNGTFLASGERLVSGQPRDLRPGDRFYIGDLRNQFEVRIE